nr:GtrA family protein [uncultured Hyphomonas sp.]
MRGNGIRAEILRFGLIGGGATLIHTIVAYSLTFLTGFPQLVINTMAFLVAFSFSGVGHTYFTFRVRQNRLRAIAKWFVVSVAGLIAGNAIIWSCMTLAGQPAALAQAIGIGGTVVFSFLASRLWAFRPASEEAR